jgi:hypothetical protein
VSAIRALGNGATSASAYAASQAGYDQAILDLTALGGVIELSGGLETVNLGTIPSNIVVLRFRTGSVTGMEVAGGSLIAQSGQSVRFIDSGGTIRTVLTALSDNTVRLAMMDNTKGIKLTNIAGAQLLLLTSTTLDIGTILSLGGDPGALNKTIINQGPGSTPIWGFPAGLSGSTMVALLAASMWGNGLSTTTPGTGAYVYNSMSGAADNSNYMVWTVPLAYTATTTWKLYWSGTGGGGNAVYEFSMFKIGGAGFDFSTATFTAGAQQTVAVPATSVLAITTMPTPAVALTAGDKVVLRIRRIGNDVNDTSATATNFIGMEHTYT